ncbi:MAG: substrate-binding domain-containing protein [Nitrospira sp.]|nr:substrate-binding domain-containing protein [Nitrospira sp.]MCY4131096.1 substrate-binding domain-containing protein [Nitrospira sp.]
MQHVQKNSTLPKINALTAFYLITLLLPFGCPVLGAAEELTGSAMIVGNGPERYAIEALAKNFEALHPKTSLDFFWHQNARPVEEVRESGADIAITGQAEQDLPSTTVAWDGIAVVTNFSNPIEDITRDQLAKIFSGKIKFWSQVYEDGPEARISLIHRNWNQNIRQPFETWLDLENHKEISAKVVEKENDTFKAINGDIYSISYVSMGPALQARKDGYGVTLLFIDDIEPEYQTVLDGTYPLRRPVVFVMNPKASPVAKAFLEYVLSPQGQRAIKIGASGLFQDKTSSVIKYYPLDGE